MLHDLTLRQFNLTHFCVSEVSRGDRSYYSAIYRAIFLKPFGFDVRAKSDISEGETYITRLHANDKEQR